MKSSRSGINRESRRHEVLIRTGRERADSRRKRLRRDYPPNAISAIRASTGFSRDHEINRLLIPGMLTGGRQRRPSFSRRTSCKTKFSAPRAATAPVEGFKSCAHDARTRPQH